MHKVGIMNEVLTLVREQAGRHGARVRARSPCISRS